eukprot:745898-Hanusia_phi.AAC.1
MQICTSRVGVANSESGYPTLVLHESASYSRLFSIPWSLQLSFSSRRNSAKGSQYHRRDRNTGRLSVFTRRELRAKLAMTLWQHTQLSLLSFALCPTSFPPSLPGPHSPPPPDSQSPKLCDGKGRVVLSGWVGYS